MTLDEMRAAALTPSIEQRRAEYQGWRFHEIDVVPFIGGYRLRGSFICVCGREEMFMFMLPTQDLGLPDYIFEAEILNVGRRLTRDGSFSRQHLLEDGYTSEQIDEFERRGAEFDSLQARPAFS